jgi:hypothetical protein
MRGKLTRGRYFVRSDSIRRQSVQCLEGLSCKQELKTRIFHPPANRSSAVCSFWLIEILGMDKS